MTVTREQFDARQSEIRQNEYHTRTRVNEGLLQQAVVASELLTQHPAWDVYLQRIQILLNDAEGELAHWREKVAGAYADADLRMVQMQVNIFQDRVQTLKHCMNLPKEILSHAAESLDNANK